MRVSVATSTLLALIAIGIFGCGRSMKTPKPLATVAQNSVEEKWPAVSNSAVTVTGDIYVSPTYIRAASQSIPLKFVRETSFPTDFEGTLNARVYAVQPPDNPHLLHGNTLCNGPVRWITIWHPGRTELHFEAYSGSEIPLKEDAVGHCGDFEYSLNPDAIALAKSAGPSGLVPSSAPSDSATEPATQNLPTTSSARDTDEGQRWSAATSATISITGDIQLSDTYLRAASKVFHLKFVRSLTLPTYTGGPYEAKLYAVEPPTNPSLLSRNQLCPASVKWILAWSPNPGELNISSYSGDSTPKREDDQQAGYCGSFQYYNPH